MYANVCMLARIERKTIVNSLECVPKVFCSLKDSLCRSPDPSERGAPLILQSVAPSIAPSQCGLEYAPKAIWRVHCEGPQIRQGENELFEAI